MTDGNIEHEKKVYHAFKDDISMLEQRITDMQVAFDDSQRAIQAGLQNVYDKFVEIEKILLDKSASKSECEEHESDGQQWKIFDIDEEHWFKCKNCEQFYR